MGTLPQPFAADLTPTNDKGDSSRIGCYTYTHAAAYTSLGNLLWHAVRQRAMLVQA
jgi:hypothetical protein